MFLSLRDWIYLQEFNISPSFLLILTFFLHPNPLIIVITSRVFLRHLFLISVLNHNIFFLKTERKRRCKWLLAERVSVLSVCLRYPLIRWQLESVRTTLIAKWVSHWSLGFRHSFIAPPTSALPKTLGHHSVFRNWERDD